MTISKFDKKNLKELREDLEKAFAVVEEKHGIKLSMGGIKFTEDTFNVTLTSALSSNGETVLNAKWKADFVKSAMFFGMKPEDFGRQVTAHGKLYTIVGARARKDELILQSLSDDKCYSIPSKAVSLV